LNLLTLLQELGVFVDDAMNLGSQNPDIHVKEMEQDDSEDN
jgi:hypothetical protein